MNFRVWVHPSAHSHQGTCSSAIASSLKGLSGENSNRNFMSTRGMACSSAHTLQRMRPSKWKNKTNNTPKQNKNKRIQPTKNPNAFWLAAPKASYLSLISRHTNCSRVPSRQAAQAKRFCTARSNTKEEPFLQQTAQGQHAWMGKLFSSPFHLLLIVSERLRQNRDNAAVSIATVTHSKAYHVRNEAFIIKFSRNY